MAPHGRRAAAAGFLTVNRNELGDVRYWLIADIRLGCDLRLLYPRKRTFFITGVYVR